jgi:hypothetical protein
MAFKTAEASVGVGLGLTGVVYAIFNSTMPSVADVRSVEADNRDLQKSRRTATVMSAILVGGVGLMTGDATAYIIGGMAIVGMDWIYRHADQVSPLTGTATAQLMMPDLNAQSPDTPSDYVYVDAAV